MHLCCETCFKSNLTSFSRAQFLMSGILLGYYHATFKISAGEGHNIGLYSGLEKLILSRPLANQTGKSELQQQY